MMLLLTKTLTKYSQRRAHGGSLSQTSHRGLSSRRWFIPPRLSSLFLYLLCTLLVSLGTACDSFSRPETPAWLPSLWGAAQTATPQPITTELRLATWSVSAAVDEYFRTRLAAYQQTQPETRVEVTLLPNYATRLRTALESETPPDVVRVNASLVPDLVAKGLLAPLPTALVAQADLSPLLQQMGEVDGTPYCLPQDVNTLALLYNRTRFDAAQVAYPTADWSWETLRTTAEQLTDTSTGVYGLVLPADFSRWLPFLYQAGGTVMDSTTLSMTMTSPAAATALQFYSDLVLDGVAAPPTALGNSWAGEAFAQEHAAMVIEGNWLIPYLAETAATLNYGVVPLPVGPGGKATLAFVNCYAIAESTTQAVAASNLIEFLTNPESQHQWLLLTAALPARTALLDTWLLAYPAQSTFAQVLGTAYPWRFRAGFQPVIDVMNDGLQKIYGGFVLPDSVLAEADAIGNEPLPTQQNQP